MKDQKIYAVVDIETTGTKMDKDKIIQFACVLVQNRKIINYFSTDINPLKSIPKNIENLTGITNQQVANSPYFEDIAPIITELLSDCTFVAHNVYFDFTFLNSELSRANEKELTIDCIDTVELAQVLFPKSPGFRVTDLADYLDLSHDNPHQALSDAYVTAEIFIEIVKKLDSIPLITLEKMADLAVHLGVNNQQVFKRALLEKRDNYDFDRLENIKTIDMISLRVKDYSFKESAVITKTLYPKTAEEKRELIEAEFNYRESQGKMMDVIHEFVTNENEPKNLMIEASTGSGKTLGYLLPLSYQKKKPIIISTSTILLQEQLLDISIPQLEKIKNQPVKGMILKSSRHFIDLEKFYRTLMMHPNEQKQYVINQLAILTWLIETDTGDLDEVNLNKKHLFFEHIEHRGLQTLQADSLFVKEDFLSYLEEKKQAADIIVINHAFLCEENNREQALIPESDVLVIDEAHKLIPIMEDNNIISVSLKRISSLLKKIRESEESLADVLESQTDKTKHIIEFLGTFSLDAREDIHWLEAFLLDEGRLNDSQNEVAFESIGELSSWPTVMKKNVKELLIIFREMNQLISEFLDDIPDIMKEVSYKNYFPVLDYIKILTNFSQENDKLRYYFQAIEDGGTRWLCLDQQQLILKQTDFKKVSIQETSWYPKFQKIIYTSGTLQLDVASDYFETQLDLPDPQKLMLKENFSYEDRAELLVMTDDRHEDFSDTKNYVNYLAEAIIQTYRLKSSSMLVLFTSHQMLRLVYKQLQVKIKQEEVDIFAQGITGTKEKIAKRFIKNNGGIILGANSFWEGVDFNLPHLDIIMMTKLPFDPPKRPVIEAKYRYLEEMGKNPFYDEAIPQAGSRLRQGLGRLLRGENDRGIIICLDSRLTGASYSSNLLKYLPEALPIKELSLNEVLTEIMNFFTEKKVKD